MSEKEIYSGPNFRYRPDKNNFTEKEGSEFFYYESGQLKAEYNYKNGKLDGFAREYYENGQLKEEVNYKDGQVVQENLETELKDFCNIAYEDDKLKLEFD